MAPKPTLESNPASRAFASATLTKKDATIHKKKTTAYYRDSSGRACVQVRAQLDFSDSVGKEADALLQCGCIEPAPVESDAVKKALAAASSPAKNNDDDNGGENKEDGEAWRDELSTIGPEVGGEMSQFASLIDTSFTFECIATNKKIRLGCRGDNHS